MRNSKLLICILGLSSLFISCKSDIEKRNDAIIETLSKEEFRHHKGTPIEQTITVVQADSLEYWPSSTLEEALKSYAYMQKTYDNYRGQSNYYSSTSTVLKAAEHGLGGTRYAAQQEAERNANKYFNEKDIAETAAKEALASTPGMPRNGVWVVEEYKYYNGGYYQDGHADTDYYLYKFSDKGELLSGPQILYMGNPFEIINILSFKPVYSLTQISSKTGDEYNE